MAKLIAEATTEYGTLALVLMSASNGEAEIVIAFGDTKRKALSLTNETLQEAVDFLTAPPELEEEEK